MKYTTSAKSGIVTLCLFALFLAGCASAPRNGPWAAKYPAKVTYNDSKWCVPLKLKATLRKVSRRFGPVSVHSTHRWPLENKRKGGKPKSYHLKCRATDFSVNGNPSEVIAYLKSLRAVGGYSYYQQGFYHIDNGPRRTW